MSKCDDIGHMWVTTTSPGWFSCQQVIGNKVTKRNPVGVFIYCNMVAYCPGCLGYRLEGYNVLMCQQHACVNIHLFPVMGAAPSQSYMSLAGEQQSLW